MASRKRAKSASSLKPRAVPASYSSVSASAKSLCQILQLLQPQYNAVRRTAKDLQVSQHSLVAMLLEAGRIDYPNLAILQTLATVKGFACGAHEEYSEFSAVLAAKSNEYLDKNLRPCVEAKKNWQDALTDANNAYLRYEAVVKDIEKTATVDSERLFQQQTDLHSCLVKEYESYETNFRYLEARNSTMVALYNMHITAYTELCNIHDSISHIGKLRTAAYQRKSDPKPTTLQTSIYHNLVQVATCDSMIDALFQVAAPQEDSIELFETILKTLDSQGKTLPYIERALAKVLYTSFYLHCQEVSSTTDKATLFRGNTATTRSMTIYMRFFGHTIIDTVLKPILGDVFKSPDGYEVDTHRLNMTAEEKERNLRNLRDLCERFLNAIVDNLHQFPLPLKMMAYYVRKEVIAKFPDSYYIAVGGLIFLRFLCPAISTPGPLLPSPLPEEVRRPLVLVSKTLQTLANGINFRVNSKEDYMLEMNIFIDKNKDKVCSFFDAFASIPEDAKLEPLCTDEEAHTTIYPRFYQFLIVHLEKISKELMKNKEEELLDKLIVAMGELGGIEGVEPLRSSQLDTKPKKRELSVPLKSPSLKWQTEK